MLGCPAVLWIELRRFGWIFQNICKSSHTEGAHRCKISIESIHMYSIFKTQNSMYLYTYNVKFHNVSNVGRKYLSQKSKLKHVSLNNFFSKFQKRFFFLQFKCSTWVAPHVIFRVIKDLWLFLTSLIKMMLSKPVKVSREEDSFKNTEIRSNTATVLAVLVTSSCSALLIQ